MTSHVPLDLEAAGPDGRTGPGLDGRRTNPPMAAHDPRRVQENAPLDASPAGVQHSDHAPLIAAQKNRNAIRRKNRQRLSGRLREEAVNSGIFFRAGKRRDHLEPRTMDLLRRSRPNRPFSPSKETAQRPGRPGVAMTSVRRKKCVRQGRWKKDPLFSEPVCTPRMAIMISSGLEEASSAVSREISPFWMRLISA